MENHSPNGIVAVTYSALEFNGINNCSNNTGQAVQVRLSLVTKTDIIATGIIHRLLDHLWMFTIQQCLCKIL